MPWKTCPADTALLRQSFLDGLSASRAALLVGRARDCHEHTVAHTAPKRAPSLRTIYRYYRQFAGKGQPQRMSRRIRGISRLKGSMAVTQTVREKRRLNAAAHKRMRQRNRTSDIVTHPGAGWQILRGARTTGSSRARDSDACRLSDAEAALRRHLSVTALAKTAQHIRRQYLAKTDVDKFELNRLFRLKDSGDRRRIIWRSVGERVQDVFTEVTASIARAMNLPESKDFEVNIIVSLPGAAKQADHKDTTTPNSYSFLYALSERHIHVTDSDTKTERLLKLKAGDVLVLHAGTCHSAADHSFSRNSTLVFVAYNFTTEGATTFCEK